MQSAVARSGRAQAARRQKVWKIPLILFPKL